MACAKCGQGRVRSVTRKGVSRRAKQQSVINIANAMAYSSIGHTGYSQTPLDDIAKV